jgi:GntR family transcriptional regulator
VYYNTHTHRLLSLIVIADFFNINTGSTEPIYRQLIEQVRRRVASGQLTAGQEMPSVREVALALAVHPMTISKAYSMMEAQGLLQRRRGLSMVIAAQHIAAKSTESRVELLRPTLEKAASETSQLELRPAQALKLFKQILREGVK